jgi:phospholipid transport system substrate-binding protein
MYRMSRILSRATAIPGALLFLALLVLPTRADERISSHQEAQTFVRSLAQHAVASLTGRDVTQAERERAFRGLLVAHFDVPQIGKWALGRYWRIATEAEQREYLDLFEEFIVTTYAQRFRDYTNEQLEVVDVKKATDEDGGLVVNSHIVRDQPKPIRIDWRVAPQPGSSDGGYKIVDVVVEGVSMVQTQRSEFSSVIGRNGGKVTGLITELKLKTQQLRAQAQ